MGFIYKITSPTNRVYIGKTKSIKQRVRDYRWRSGKRKSILISSLKCYGWDAHKFEVIEECEDLLMSEREIFWIKELDTFYLENILGMNMTRGGEQGGQKWMHDIERRKNQSERVSGKGNTFYSKKHTEENKKLIGELTKKRNLANGRRVPKWGAEKGRLKRIIPMLVYSSNGDLVKECESILDAVKFTKQPSRSIYKVCKGDRTNAGGYVFRFKTENYPIKIEIGIIKKQTVKRPVYLLDDNLEPVCEFSSAQEASDFFGISKTTINRAALYNDLNPIRTGHIFLYKDMYLGEYKLTA